MGLIDEMVAPDTSTTRRWPGRRRFVDASAAGTGGGQGLVRDGR